MNESKPKTPIKPSSVWLIGSALGVTLLAFLAGRGTAPNPPANMGTNEAPTSTNSTSDATTASGVAAEGEAGEEHEEEHEHGDEAIAFTPEALQQAGVEVEPVVARPQISGIPFNGEIEVSPAHMARVASVVSGRVTRLYVAIGQRVQRGQTLALIESRSVGEAQSTYRQAATRLQTARASYDVVVRQARAGVFSQAPLETARRAQVEAEAGARTSVTAVAQARLALENAQRLARVGSYARPALEAARNGYAQTVESVRAAQAALDNAQASVSAAQSEVARRRQIAASGGYTSRPVEEARRGLVAAQSARATAESEVATTRAGLNRARSLAAEGLVATRDVEAAQTALATAQSRLTSAQTDERTAQSELERQQRLAATDVTGTAEVGEASAKLASAQADVRTRRAEAARARSGLEVASGALRREQAVFRSDVANRREVSGAQAALANAQNAQTKARGELVLAQTALRREQNIYQQNLNAGAQVQSARSALNLARSDVEAAQTALSLLKSQPGGSATIPLRAPLAGVVQERDVTQGETVEADKPLMTLVDLSTVHVDMYLPERDIARVQVGAPVQVRVDALPNSSFAGRIELIHTQLDPKTRTVEAHAELRNPGTLRPGMFARGTIGTGNNALALMVPRDAVQEVEGEQVVFVQGAKAGEFSARPVDVGATESGLTHIKGGLRAGEKVVVRGAFMVKAQSMKAELGHED